MAKTLLVRDVDDYTLGILRRVARREDRSVTAQIRVWLREAADRDEEEEVAYQRAHGLETAATT